MKKTNVVLIAVCLLVGVVVFVATARAQSGVVPRRDLSGLKIVAYSSGLTGFFDPGDGKLYLYDSNLERCILVRQLTELGEPMKMIKN